VTWTTAWPQRHLPLRLAGLVCFQVDDFLDLAMLLRANSVLLFIAYAEPATSFAKGPSEVRANAWAEAFKVRYPLQCIETNVIDVSQT